MTKIEQLIGENELEFDRYTHKATISRNELNSMMIEYAEYYAIRCLEIADQNLLDEEKGLIRGIWPTDIKLPEHD